MVRALVAGVGAFPEPQPDEDDLAEGISGFRPLDSVKSAAQALASALDRLGVATGGDALLECDKDAFLDRWRTLRQDTEREEALVVHFAGHGALPSGRLFLAAAGASDRSESLVETCISVGQLLEEAELSERPVLFLLDVCGAGQALVQQQLAELAAQRRQDATRTVWIIGACAADAIAYGAGFTTAAAEVLHQLADGDLDVSPSLEYVPVETLAAAIDRQLARSDRAAGRPRRTVMRTVNPSAASEPAPFFRNPAHATGSAAGFLAGLDPRLREFALGCAPGLDALHFATRAAGNASANEIMFTGRRSQLARIQAWIDEDGNDRGLMLAVTGGPGSGKSALLGVTACLLHPELAPQLAQRVGNAVADFEPRQPGTVLAVHARQLTVQQIADALRGQLGRQNPQVQARHGSSVQPDGTAPVPAMPIRGPDVPPGTDLEDLVRDLRAAGDVLIVLDALDEAADPGAVVAELLLPMTRADSDDGGATSRPRVRVLVGTRPWWDTLPTLRDHLDTHPGSRLDLDPTSDVDRDELAADLEAYLRKQLPPHHTARPQIPTIAQRVARYSDHGAFLVAALYAEHLRTTPTGSLAAQPPCTVTEVFDMHVAALAANDPWIRPVLAAVGSSRGQGMPLDLIHTVAAAHRPADPDRPATTLTDTRRVLDKAAFYLRTTPDTDQRLLYRYFHEALAEHTKSDTVPATVHQALILAVPTGTGDDTIDWAHAHPYLLRHAAEHADQTNDGALDRLLTDLDFLLHADPDTLAPYLHRATSEQATVHARIYRSNATHHPDRHDPTVRRDLLTLDALAWQQPDIARTLTTSAESRSPCFEARWATSSTHPARRQILNSHTVPVTTIAAVTTRDGTALAVTAGEDGTVIVWNLATGTVRHTLTGHSSRVTEAAAATSHDGSVLAVTCAEDGTVIVWDLIVGTAHRTFAGHSGPVTAVTATTDPDGAALAVTAGEDGTVIVWNLATGTVRHTLTGHSSRVTEAAIATGHDGTIVALTRSAGGQMIVWDLATGTKCDNLTAHHPLVRAVAITIDPDGTLLAVTGHHDCTVIVWDLATGSARYTLTDHTDSVNAITVSADSADGAFVVTGSRDGAVIVWDLATGSARHTLTGHARPVTGVAAVTGADGAALVITCSSDGVVFVWDLTADTPHTTLTGHAFPVTAVTVTTDPDGIALAVTVDERGTVIVRDLATGAVRHTITGNSRKVAVANGPDGSALAIMGNRDGTVTVDDQSTGTTHRALDAPVPVEAATDPELAAALAAAYFDRTAIVWDLAAGTARHTLTGHAFSVSAFAVTKDSDGTELAVTTDNARIVFVWDLTAGTARHILTSPGAVTAVAVASDPAGTVLAIAANHDGTVIVWDLADGTVRHILAGHNWPVSTLTTATDSDGTPLAITTDQQGTAIVWDLATGTIRHILTAGIHKIALTVNADGTPLAVTDGHPLAVTDSGVVGTVNLWDLAEGTIRHTLPGHIWSMTAITTASDPIGTPLAITTGNDRTVIVWDLNAGQKVFRHHLPHAGSLISGTHGGFLIAYGRDVAYFAQTPMTPVGVDR